MITHNYRLTLRISSITHTIGRLAFADMSTQKDVVDSLMSLYCLFVTLGYLTKDEINWPPHDVIPFNVSRCVELGYDPSAIELLRRIPWATEMLPIYYESIPVDYSCDDELEGSRDPTHYMIDYPDDPQPVDGWILPLTYGQTKGQTILLDAREGEWSPSLL